jgi:hypothetical protein
LVYRARELIFALSIANARSQFLVGADESPESVACNCFQITDLRQHIV